MKSTGGTSVCLLFIYRELLYNFWMTCYTFGQMRVTDDAQEGQHGSF